MTLEVEWLGRSVALPAAGVLIAWNWRWGNEVGGCFVMTMKRMKILLGLEILSRVWSTMYTFPSFGWWWPSG